MNTLCIRCQQPKGVHIAVMGTQQQSIPMRPVDVGYQTWLVCPTATFSDGSASVTNAPTDLRGGAA